MTSRERGILFLKGIAMGMADSVPGVSGGTIAFISGIYEELVEAIKSIGWEALKIWRKEGFAAAWRHIHGDFLATLALGIGGALLLLARVIVFLLENYSPLLLAFFFGLVVGSAWLMGQRVKQWRAGMAALLLCGFGLAAAVSYLPGSAATPGWPYFFFSGAVAICAMILPGISGALLLVILGAYQPVLEALSALNLGLVIPFAAGCASGLMLFSRLLSWLLRRCREATLSFLLGLLGGSLFMLWPWRLEAIAADGAVVFENLSPAAYAMASGIDIAWPPCLVMAVIGCLLVIGLDYMAHRGQAPNNGEEQD